MSWIVNPEVVARAAYDVLTGTAEQREARAIIATAIAFAENPARDVNARGDLSLQNAKWGPSFGLWQIRTLKAETGKGTHRDIEHLHNSVLHQAQAMQNISGNGTNWSPWSVYTEPPYRYRDHIPAATKAVTGREAAPELHEPDEGAVEAGLGPLPNPLSAVAAFARLLSSWATWQRVLYVLAGLGLVGAGIALLAADSAAGAGA